MSSRRRPEAPRTCEFARTNIARRLVEAGELEQARAHLGRAVGYARHPSRLAHLGAVLERLGHENDARRLYDEQWARVECRREHHHGEDLRPAGEQRHRHTDGQNDDTAT